MRNLSILVTWLILSTPSLAQTATLTPDSFFEVVQSAKPVAGGLLRGIQQGKENDRLNIENFSVFVPQTAHRRLCFFAKSQNGSYIAEAEFSLVNKPKERIYALRINSKHKAVLESFVFRDFSMLAYLGDRCPAKNPVYLPVLHEAGVNMNEKLLILVNSRSLHIRVRVYDSRSKIYHKCEHDTAGISTITFDTECLLPHPETGGMNKYVIVRNRGEKQLKNLDVEMYLP